jgi:Phage integrase family
VGIFARGGLEPGKTRKLGNRPATRIDAARMLKRRLKDAGLSDAFSPHSFRATGITNFLENGRTLEVAQRIAGHADSRTTKLYDRLAADFMTTFYHVQVRALETQEFRTSPVRVWLVCFSDKVKGPLRQCSSSSCCRTENEMSTKPFYVT